MFKSRLYRYIELLFRSKYRLAVIQTFNSYTSIIMAKLWQQALYSYFLTVEFFSIFL